MPLDQKQLGVQKLDGLFPGPVLSNDFYLQDFYSVLYPKTVTATLSQPSFLS